MLRELTRGGFKHKAERKHLQVGVIWLERKSMTSEGSIISYWQRLPNAICRGEKRCKIPEPILQYQTQSGAPGKPGKDPVYFLLSL